MLLVCAGLEHARRGFESFASECFTAIRDDPGLDLGLVKGSGPRAPKECSIPSPRRDGVIAGMLGRLVDKPSFRIEAFTFGFALTPLLLSRRPDLVYMSEWDTARALAIVRTRTRLDFKLLLSNGGFASSGFGHLDAVQELTPAGRDYVVERGADPEKHTVLPLGFHIQREFSPVSSAERGTLRRRLGLPADRTIVISVAALNQHHKRLDYVIEEVARLPSSRPFLLFVGEPDAETPGLQEFASERLGSGGYEMRTVRADEVPHLLRASDVFVLASIVEAQGRALVEAMAHGLPCIAHDSPVMRFAVGDHGTLGDLSQPGALAPLLVQAMDRLDNETERRMVAHARHRLVYERFSWERLTPRYVEFLRDVAAGGAESRIETPKPAGT